MNSATSKLMSKVAGSDRPKYKASDVVDFVIVGSGAAGGVLAKKLKPQRMRQVFAGILFVVGAWQALSAWAR